MEFGKVERVSLPDMMVASYEVTSDAPEQTAIKFVENWLQKKGLKIGDNGTQRQKIGENGVRGFGFDCHKGRNIPDGCRIYHVYYSIPETLKGDSDVEIKEFSGGDYARLIITDPFSGDFPAAWYVLLKWTFENNVGNGIGCTSPDDCYSLFSNEETPCLEELYMEDGVQYMAFYLPIK
jgi:effector-binding domain-containing protein